MDLKLFTIAFFSILISMVILDALWLGVMLKRFYQPQIGHLMSDTPKVLPAALFYLLFAFSLAFFIVVPSFQSGLTTGIVLLLGMLFGLTAYATYDLTNQAILKNWPTIVTVVDLAWGTFLTGIVSAISFSVIKHFIPD